MKTKIMLLIIFVMFSNTYSDNIIADRNFRDSISKKLNLKNSILITKDKLETVDSIIINNRINDISGIEYMINLKELIITGSQNLQYLDKISNLVKLTSLTISKIKMRDASILSNLINLIFLDLGDNKITNVRALKNLTKLQMLIIDRNLIKDISFITNLELIENFDAGYNRISTIPRLNKCLKLIDISLNGNEIKDASVLITADNLRDISLDSNKITDISWIFRLKYLNGIDVGNNPLRNIESIKEGIAKTKIKIWFN